MKNFKYFFLLLLLAGNSSFGQSYDYCIRNVTIIAPEKASPLLPHRDVFIGAGKIVRIFSSTKAVPKQCKEIIDGSGKFLMAGLCDMHVHLPSENIDKFLLLNLDAGVTTMRSMRGKTWHIELKKKLASGTQLGPDLYIATPYFPNKNIKLSDLPDSIRGYKAAGFDFIKVLAVPDSAYYEALMKTAKEIGFPVVGHQPGQIPISRLIESDYACLEHLQGLDEAFEKDSSSIYGFAEMLKKHNTYNCPTLDYYNVMWEQVPLDELQQRSGLEYIDPKTVAEWKETIGGYFEKTNRGSGDSVRRKKEKLRNYMQNKFRLVKKLNELGTPMIMSPAEANDPFGVPGFCLWEEMKLYAAAGIPNKDILKMATYTPAEFFHETSSWGSIEEGHKANLLLLEKNPLESIDNISSRDGVFIGGRFYPKSKLEHLIKG